MEHLLWFEVLNHFDKRGYIDNGLTIPFLIGASSILSPKEQLLTIRELIEECDDENLPSRITILECGNIGEIVIGILDKESANFYKNYKYLHAEFNNIMLLDQSFKDLMTIEQFIITLENRYGEIIESGSFSKRDGIWDDYSEIDLQRLIELKNQV